MNASNRPLSPHLQVYRLPMTAVMSITHRLTGVALAAGSLLFAAWLLAIAAGPEVLATVQAVCRSWFGLLVMFGFTFAVFYHLCNGVRHMVWDVGCWLEVESAERAGYVVIAAAAILTVLVWVLALA